MYAPIESMGEISLVVAFLLNLSFEINEFL